MPFAPHEIEQKRFVVALRGYQTDEVEAFLRAVAADYRAALAAGNDDAALREQIERLEHAVATSREHGERAEAQIAEMRRVATAHLHEERLAVQAEIAELRAAAEREAGEIRDAAAREAEAAYAEIARQAEELRRLEASLWSRMHALEHTVVECRQALSHVSNLQPMTSTPLQTTTLPTVEELLYRVEAASLAPETNAEVATADL